jgi:hypothetical protein
LKLLLRYLPMTLALIASAIVVTFWIRSYVAGDAYHYVNLRADSAELALRRAGFFTGLGGVGCYFEYVETAQPYQIERIRARIEMSNQFYPRGYQTNPNPRYPIRWASEDGSLASLGLLWRHTNTSGDGVSRRRIWAAAPFWLLFAVFFSYPMIRYVGGVLRRQREDREALGLCPRCGVPLKTGSMKCPGCDRVVAVAPEA